jgi:zinc protease
MNHSVFNTPNFPIHGIGFLFTKRNQNKIKEFKVEFEQFSLDNGLHVIMHIDRSDPVVAVALTSQRDQHERKSVVLVLPIYLNIYYFRVRENLGKVVWIK